MRHFAELAELLATTRVLSMVDREADFFALFAEQRLGAVDLLARARHNRNLPVPVAKREEPNLFDWVCDRPGRARLAIEVARVCQRVGMRNQSASALRRSRTARVSLCWHAVSLTATEESSSPDEPPVELWAVHLAEQGAAENSPTWCRGGKSLGPEEVECQPADKASSAGFSDAMPVPAKSCRR